MLKPQTIPLIEVLETVRAIETADQQLIQDTFTLRRVKSGEILLLSGNTAKEMFFIAKGILKITTINEKGNHVAQFFLKEKQFCTILNSLNNSVPAKESIVAACDSELLVISKVKLQLLYRHLPYFEQLIAGITTQTLLAKIKTRNAYMGEDASTRYRKFISLQPDLALRLPLVDIASYLGITQQSLSRIRRNIR